MTCYSTHLNPTEHDWDAFVRRIEQRTILPRTVQELQTTLRQEWVPKGHLESVVKSMENRCKICISVLGRHTSY
ncbi:hypothetical protein TNCV_1198241 [Trichonephila clavipes]|uniref:Uncharacterized protein n=1 Tax=Trichonephila clavipes TaxID=2585209 RepID=A0A8X6S0C5_TRICX|nr:hypothetical protein TNCV_1198241 [Trichonephila clavipes]